MTDDPPLTQLMQRLHELRRDDGKHRAMLLDRLDSLTETVAELQTQTRGIAASLQALIAHDVKTHSGENISEDHKSSKSPPAAPSPDEISGQTVVEDLFVEGWGAWRYHQRTKLGELAQGRGYRDFWEAFAAPIAVDQVGQGGKVQHATEELQTPFAQNVILMSTSVGSSRLYAIIIEPTLPTHKTAIEVAGRPDNDNRCRYVRHVFSF